MYILYAFAQEVAESGGGSSSLYSYLVHIIATLFTTITGHQGSGYRRSVDACVALSNRTDIVCQSLTYTEYDCDGQLFNDNYSAIIILCRPIN